MIRDLHEVCQLLRQSKKINPTTNLIEFQTSFSGLCEVIPCAKLSDVPSDSSDNCFIIVDDDIEISMLSPFGCRVLVLTANLNMAKVENKDMVDTMVKTKFIGNEFTVLKTMICHQDLVRCEFI